MNKRDDSLVHAARLLTIAFVAAVLFGATPSAHAATSITPVGGWVPGLVQTIYIGRTTHTQGGVAKDRTWVCASFVWNLTPTESWIDVSGATGNDTSMDYDINVIANGQATMTVIRASTTTSTCKGDGTTPWLAPVYNSHFVDLYGYSTADTMYTGAAQYLSYAYGGAGNDSIAVYGADNAAFGQAGDDFLQSGFGSTFAGLNGGDGNDDLYMFHNDAIAYGEAGDDDIFGYAARESFYGGEGSDCLYEATLTDLNVLYCQGAAVDYYRLGMTPTGTSCVGDSAVAHARCF